VLGDLLTTSPTRTALRKKVVLLHPRFAIAWTGHVIAAALVLRHLRSGEPIVDLPHLERALAALKSEDFGSMHVTLVGWMITDSDEDCFRWRSDFPSEVFTGDPMTDGSGDFLIDQNLGPSGLRHSPAASGEQPPDPVEAALSVAAELVRPELHGASNVPLGFGFAYELLALLDDRTFQYVGPVTYLGVSHRIALDGTYQGSSFLGPILTTTQLGDLTALYRFDPNHRADERHVVSAPDMAETTHLKSLAHELLSPAHRRPIADGYFCLLSYLICGDRPSPRLVMTGRVADNPVLRFDHSTSTLSLSIDPGMVEWMHGTIGKDATR
jgi:hypothetical protein